MDAGVRGGRPAWELTYESGVVGPKGRQSGVGISPVQATHRRRIASCPPPPFLPRASGVWAPRPGPHRDRIGRGEGCLPDNGGKPVPLIPSSSAPTTARRDSGYGAAAQPAARVTREGGPCGSSRLSRTSTTVLRKEAAPLRTGLGVGSPIDIARSPFARRQAPEIATVAVDDREAVGVKGLDAENDLLAVW